MKNIYDIDQVKVIINQQFSNFSIYQIQRIGAGYDCEAFMVNDAFVFKFPKHQGASDNLLKEMNVLIELEDKLPISTPKVLFKGHPNDFFPMVFAGYNKISGEVLTPDLLRRLPSEIQDDIAADLARFLRVLHNVRLEKHQSQLVIETREKYLEEHMAINSILLNEGLTLYQDIIDGFYQEIISDTDFFNYKPCLVHNDLSSDHILFDTNQNKICGVIDFGDVAISDPDHDFLYLLEDEEEYGIEFTLNVLKHYQHNNIDLVLKKFRLKEKYWTFEKILYGKEYGIDEWVEEGIDEIKKMI